MYGGNSITLGTLTSIGTTEFDELEVDAFGLSWSEVCTAIIPMTITSGPSFVSITGARMN